MSTVSAVSKEPAALVEPDSDFYRVREILSPAERDKLLQVRRFLEAKAAPLVTDFWKRDAFPFELVPGLRELGIVGVGIEGYGCPGGSTLFQGFLFSELARVDCSLATFYGVQSGLTMGSIVLCGSEEQKQRWLPSLAKLETIGSFGLTEPDVGSGASRGLTTTAKREGDTWILNGEKKWIGNATWGDLTVVWARDLADDQVKGFVVENKKNPGFSVEKIENKIALRIVQNGHITLRNCRVPESDRLQLDRSFRDTARVLRMTRAGVAWISVGCQMGVYEHALRYTQRRHQFGHPIAGFQMIQDHLAQMVGNITASQCLVVRLSELQDQGKLKDEHASLAKAFCTVRMRDTVARAREVLGANGILLEHQVARFFADAEGVYSYEGTREMNHLIVAKSVSGFSAFV